MLKKICKKTYEKLNAILLCLFCYGVSLSSWADLPKPPDKNIANSSNDWIDVGGALAYKAITYGAIALGAIILLSGAWGVIKAYKTSQIKDESGHFFSNAGMSIVAIAIGSALVYAGWSIVPSK